MKLNYIIITYLSTFIFVNADQYHNSNYCRSPGAHKCGLIVSSWLTANGLPNGTQGGKNINVVNGDCDTIVSKNNVGPKSPGFSGTIDTIYGTTLYFGADSIGLSNIRGISFQYRGQSKTQKDCNCRSDNKGLKAGTTCQCNFDC